MLILDDINLCGSDASGILAKKYLAKHLVTKDLEKNYYTSLVLREICLLDLEDICFGS